MKNYVRARDKYTCQSCKERGNIIEAHHIIPRSQHGTDTPENMICLCLKCHVMIQNNLHLSPKPKPQLFVASGVLNSVSKEIFKQIGDMVSVSKTYGYVTDAYRKDLKLEKTHAGDASIIAFCDEDSYLDTSAYTWIETHVSHMFLKQFRRHVRNWDHIHEDRKYKIGKTIVAWNRRCRDGQDGKKKPSLETFRHEIKNRDVKLTVSPGVTRKRRSNTQMLFRPGDSLIMLVNNQPIQDVCQGWASTQGTVIGINNGYIKKKLVKRYLNNSGLVIVNKV